MRDYDPNKPLISIHVPKCGGRSLLMVLKKWFKRNMFLHYIDPKGRKPKRHYAYRFWKIQNLKKSLILKLTKKYYKYLCACVYMDVNNIKFHSKVRGYAPIVLFVYNRPRQVLINHD
jgi:hypothetical protein